MIILDTNVLSELMRPSPSERVLRWVAGQPPLHLFTTTITEAEILYGLELLPGGKRKHALRAAVTETFELDFAGRILPFDSGAASAYPAITTIRRSLGRPIAQFDAQIAAIARSRAAAIVTRNSSDFEDCGVAVVNPWTNS